MKKEPAVIAALAAAVLAAVTEIIRAGQDAGGGFNAWSAILVGLPLLAGILTRYNVIPTATVRDAITESRSAVGAVNDLANRVDVAVPERPNGRP
jgi:hypothetical protein